MMKSNVAWFLVLSLAGCAAEQAGDDDVSAAAIATPRDQEAAVLHARIEELRVALDKAKPSDFGAEVAPSAKANVERLLGHYRARDNDPGTRVYTFKTSAKKAYVFETFKGERRSLYLYDAVKDGAKEGLSPIGECVASWSDGPLWCKTTAEGAVVPRDA